MVVASVSFSFFLPQQHTIQRTFLPSGYMGLLPSTPDMITYFFFPTHLYRQFPVSDRVFEYPVIMICSKYIPTISMYILFRNRLKFCNICQIIVKSIFYKLSKQFHILHIRRVKLSIFIGGRFNKSVVFPPTEDK